MFDSTNTQLIEFTGGQNLYLLSQFQKFDNTWVLKISRMPCIVKRRNISRAALRRRDYISNQKGIMRTQSSPFGVREQSEDEILRMEWQNLGQSPKFHFA